MADKETLVQDVQALQDEVNRLTLEMQNNQSKQSLTDPRFNPFVSDILNQVIFFPVTYTLPNAEPQTAGNYSIIFVADRKCEILSFSEVHGTACSSTGTLQLEKCASGVAPDSGVALLSTTLALNTTADTPQYGVLGARANLSLKRGDRLVLKDAGTLTSTKDVSVTVWIRRV